jgi:hypothetical protein
MVDEVALRIHPFGEEPRSPEVGEDDVSGRAEEVEIESVSVTRTPRDVEFTTRWTPGGGAVHSVRMIPRKGEEVRK